MRAQQGRAPLDDVEADVDPAQKGRTHILDGFQRGLGWQTPGCGLRSDRIRPSVSKFWPRRKLPVYKRENGGII